MLKKPEFTTASENGRQLTLAVLDFLLRTALAIILAQIGGRMIADDALHYGLIGGFVVILGLTVLSGWWLRARLADAESDVVEKLETRCLGWFANAGYNDMQGWQTGDIVNRIQAHPKSLAAFWVSYPLTRAMVALGPLIIVAALVAFSWQAALLLAFSFPVMVMFMALIGGMISSAAQKREKESQYLSALFGDRIRTLPTILAHDAEGWAQTQLHQAADLYARRTMEVLRIAFVNSGVLDFFSSLSIAMLAVFLGLGHLGLANIPGFSNMPLSASLSILLLAPLFFVNFRKFAELYHLKADGESALSALAPFAADHCAPVRRLGRSDVSIDRLALPNCNKLVEFKAPGVGLVVLSGESGSGKTTLLRCMAGIERPLAGSISLPGHSQSWCSADLYVAAGRLADAISFPKTATSRDRLRDIAASLDLTNSEYLPQGLDTPLGSGADTLSGGQRMRLALARALNAGTDILFCDEPTAKLDKYSAGLVRQALFDAARTRLVVVASHDPEIIARAGSGFNMHNAPSIPDGSGETGAAIQWAKQ